MPPSKPLYKKSASMCINSERAKVLKRVRRDRKISAPAAALRYDSRMIFRFSSSAGQFFGHATAPRTVPMLVVFYCINA